jgi:hypothetical protein
MISFDQIKKCIFLNTVKLGYNEQKIQSQITTLLHKTTRL